MNVSKENRTWEGPNGGELWKLNRKLWMFSSLQPHGEADLISILAPPDAFRCPGDEGWMLAPQSYPSWMTLLSNNINDHIYIYMIIVFLIRIRFILWHIHVLVCFSMVHIIQSLFFNRRFCIFSLSWRLCPAQGLCERSEMRLPRLRWWGHGHRSLLTSRPLHLALLIPMHGHSFCVMKPRMAGTFIWCLAGLFYLWHLRPRRAVQLQSRSQRPNSAGSVLRRFAGRSHRHRFGRRFRHLCRAGSLHCCGLRATLSDECRGDSEPKRCCRSAGNPIQSKTWKTSAWIICSGCIVSSNKQINKQVNK